MKVSILLLTIDRYDETRYWVKKALDNAGYPYDLCCADNGSQDKRVIDLVASWNPKVHLLQGFNKGTTQSLNELILLNDSDAYVFIGNDIEMPNDWLKTLVEYAKSIPESGVIGINWRPVEYEKEKIGKLIIQKTDRVFGTMFITKKVRNLVGKFCEDYGTYGLWDSDYSIRCEYAGLKNYYINELKSEHRCNDFESESDYRKMKNASISKAQPIFIANVEKYKQGQWKI